MPVNPAHVAMLKSIHASAHARWFADPRNEVLRVEVLRALAAWQAAARGGDAPAEADPR